MPVLNWIDKRKVVNHHLEAHLRVLEQSMYSMLRNGTSYEKRASVPVSNLADEALAL